jgi:hypothetical protein
MSCEVLFLLLELFGFPQKHGKFMEFWRFGFWKKLKK